MASADIIDLRPILEREHATPADTDRRNADSLFQIGVQAHKRAYGDFQTAFRLRQTAAAIEVSIGVALSESIFGGGE